ncbi:MAG: type II secretion system protein [Phycisphaeraceae bacterium]
MQPLCHRTMPRPRTAKGFTLIELLVVVGIIALLMAILLPALSRARQEAIKVSCASQLRQWGIAINSFAQDHDTLMPNPGGPWDAWNTPAGAPAANDNRPFFHVNVANQPQHEWVRFYDQYLAPYNWQEFEFNKGATAVQHCPVGWTSHKSGWTAQITMGYVYLPNRGAAHFTPETAGWGRKSRLDGAFVRAPIMMDVYMREPSGDLWEGGTDAMNNHIGTDEDSVLGGNFLFEDGSVSWHNQNEIETGMDPVRDWPVRLQFKIPVPGLVN